MNLLKSGRPSVAKARAIQEMEKEEIELILVRVPASLKLALKKNVLDNRTDITKLVKKLIEKYLEEEKN